MTYLYCFGLNSQILKFKRQRLPKAVKKSCPLGIYYCLCSFIFLPLFSFAFSKQDFTANTPKQITPQESASDNSHEKGNKKKSPTIQDFTANTPKQITPQEGASDNSHEKGNKKKSPPVFSVFLKSEGRLSKNQISKNQKDTYPYVPYAELGFQYSENNNFKILINLEMESYENKRRADLDEFSLSYIFETLPVGIKTGLLPLPLGYMSKNRNVFSRDLSIYNSLTRRAEDMGVIVDLRVWREFFKLRASRFGGWLYRESDDSFQPPESGPCELSLKSRGAFWDGFLSYFETDPAFFYPVTAYGAGLRLNADYKKLSMDIQSELWRIREKGQSTFAYYVFPSIQIHTLKVGMLFGSVNRFSPNFQMKKAVSSLYERVFQVSWRAHPYIIIMGERFISTQRKGPFTNDLWALRIKVHIEWSGDL